MERLRLPKRVPRSAALSSAALGRRNLADSIASSYQELCRRSGKSDADVAVRSSATAEDLPDASFAGQQESFLNIRGVNALLDACRRCYASLFTDRAIAYRQAKGFDHLKVALSIGVQMMVRSDLGGAGVMFSIDTETGFDKVVVINAAWGLGENVVQGAVDPDEYQIYKPLLSQPSLIPIIEKTVGAKAQKMIYAATGERPTRNVPTSQAERSAFVLSDDEILALARWACVIESHYGCPMDMEWAKDGDSMSCSSCKPGRKRCIPPAGWCVQIAIVSSTKAARWLTGLAIGEAVATGQVCLIDSPSDIDQFRRRRHLGDRNDRPGLGADHEAGGRDRHRSRRPHVPCRDRQPRAGPAGDCRNRQCNELLHDGQDVTVSCAEGEQGFVYEGIADYETEELDLAAIPKRAPR